MKISEIDYYAVCGSSWLHKLEPKIKLIAVFLVLLISISTFNLNVLLTLYTVILGIVLLSKVEKLKLIMASFYPIVFLLIFAFSFKNISWIFLLTVLLKVLAISTSFSLLMFTTSYIDIFKILNKFLPRVILNVLFITYRSIFILEQIIHNIKIAFKLRIKLDFKRPIYSVNILSNMLGLFIIKTIDSNEKLYYSLKLRGF